MEKDGGLADLGPFHDVLPFARMITGPGDVVLDRFGGVLALQVFDFAVDDEILFLVHLLDDADKDVRRLLHNRAETLRRFNVGEGGAKGEGEEADRDKDDEQSCERAIHGQLPSLGRAERRKAPGFSQRQ